MAHIRQQIEQHGVPQPLIGIQQPLDPEHQEPVAVDVGMAVEVPGLHPAAQGVQAQTQLLQDFFGIQVLFLPVICLIFLLRQLIQIGENGVLVWRQSLEIGLVRDTELLVQLCQQHFQRVQMGVGEILVSPEEVF